MAFNKWRLSITQSDSFRPQLHLFDLSDDDADLDGTQLKGYLLRIPATADRTLTLPPAEKIVAELPRVRSGQGLGFVVEHTGNVGVVSLAMGTGGTMVGSADTEAGGLHLFFMRIDVGAPKGSQAYTVYSLQSGGGAPPIFTSACGEMQMEHVNATYWPAAPAVYGGAGTWETTGVPANIGAQLPYGADGAVALQNNMSIKDTGTTVSGAPIYGLYAQEPGLYRYAIVAVIYIDDWPGSPDDIGHQYRLILAQNGAPIIGVDGVSGANTQVVTSGVQVYGPDRDSFPWIGPYTITTEGIVYVETDGDYHTPFFQDFYSTGTNPSDIRVYNWTLSMNRVAPLQA